jgi:GNAT superfamily N-acetyltransferase
MMEFQTLTVDAWCDFETLFGANGACAGCWCMFPRLADKEYRAGQGEVNHQRMRSLVESGAIPGLIGYIDGQPVGWISLGPREEFPRWKNSKVLAPVDDKPVWTVVCLFIAKGFRRQGISVDLLKAAGSFALKSGANILEGYPTDPQDKKRPDAWVWTGLASAYINAGFREVARRSPTRPIMRLELK